MRASAGIGLRETTFHSADDGFLFSVRCVARPEVGIVGIAELGLICRGGQDPERERARIGPFPARPAFGRPGLRARVSGFGLFCVSLGRSHLATE